jgi:hypothetical protein
MADTAVALEERVLPRVPVRHWICSLPWGLRALLGYDRELCAKVVSAFVRELLRSLKRRAKRELGLASVADAHTGAVCAVQRTDSALRLNVHLHVLALDGVYVRDTESGELVFEALAAPSQAEVLDVARQSAERIDTLLRQSGRSLEREGEEPELLVLDEPGLAACYAAAAQGLGVSGERAGQPALRLVFGEPAPTPQGEPGASEPVAEHRGVNVHAKQWVDGRDRRQLERLCRYITRPPVAQDRLERRADGRLELGFKRPWKDGTRAVVLEADDLMVRLVSAVPPPRWHLLRYFGVLSSHSSLRKEVVPTPPDDPSAHAPPPAPGDQLELGLEQDAEPEPPRRKRWAWLLRHVFAADLDTCPRCSGPMRWVEAAATREAACDLLARLGLGPRPPPVPVPPPFGQLRLPFMR